MLFAKSKGRASDPNNFLWIAASDAAAVNPNRIKMLLANGLSTFPIKGNPAFSNGSKVYLKILLILYDGVFNNFILTEELFAKALRSFEICVLVNNNLFSSLESPTTFDEIFKLFSVLLLIPDFNLLGYEWDKLKFKVLY